MDVRSIFFVIIAETKGLHGNRRQKQRHWWGPEALAVTEWLINLVLLCEHRQVRNQAGNARKGDLHNFTRATRKYENDCRSAGAGRDGWQAREGISSFSTRSQGNSLDNECTVS